MASLTIRNLEDAQKAELRVRAARKGRSMEAEARAILREALAHGDESPRKRRIADEIHALFAPLGGVELPEIPRDANREPPDFSQ